MSLKRDLVFKLSKGFVGRGNNVFSVAKPRVTKALQNAYKDRKKKKRDQRSIWIMQTNAGDEGEKKKSFFFFCVFNSLLSRSSIVWDDLFYSDCGTQQGERGARPKNSL